jgi:hypothetical protein
VSLPRLFRATALIVACLATTLLFAISARASSAPKRLPVVYATDARGHVIHSGARLDAGQHVVVHATGFEARSRIEVVDALRRHIWHVRAGAGGAAAFDFSVPAATGRGGRFVDFAGPLPTAGRGSPADVVASVPLLRQFRYLRATGRGHAVDAASVAAGVGTGSQGLANTGFDLFALVVVAVALIVLGSLAARVRRLTTAVE